MNGTQRNGTRSWATSLLLVAVVLIWVGAMSAPSSRPAGIGFARFWLVLLGQARAIPVYVLTLIRFGLFVAAMLI